MRMHRGDFDKIPGTIIPYSSCNTSTELKSLNDIIKMTEELLEISKRLKKETRKWIKIQRSNVGMDK